MISLIIVDDHPMVREGLEAMLSSEDGFEVLGVAESVEKAVQLCREKKPDLALCDIRMPVEDGFCLLDRVTSEKLTTRVLLLAGMPLKEEEARAKEQGAIGYLPKSIEQEKLSDIIRALMAKHLDFAAETFQPTPSTLTVREMDVLRLVAKGMQREQIAAELGIGLQSVKTYMKNVLVKMHAPNATSAVGRAYELGILRA